MLNLTQQLVFSVFWNEMEVFVHNMDSFPCHIFNIPKFARKLSSPNKFEQEAIDGEHSERKKMSFLRVLNSEHGCSVYKCHSMPANADGNALSTQTKMHFYIYLYECRCASDRPIRQSCVMRTRVYF